VGYDVEMVALLVFMFGWETCVREAFRCISRVIEEEIIVEKGCHRMPSKKNPRSLEAEGARLIAESGLETIRLIGGVF